MDRSWQPRGVLHSVGNGDDCVLLGVMSSSRSPRPWPCSLHHSALRGCTARPRSRRHLLRSWCSSSCSIKSLAGCSPRLSLSLGRKSGSSGTSWSVQILEAPVPQTVERLPDVLRFFDTRLIPSRLSKCPRSSLRTSLCAPQCAIRSWRNNCLSADDRILFLIAADYGATRRHSSSWWWRAAR